ncbi:exostosin-like 2 [Corythoichthys intestinalis]|uniref:exostosin-like 2 n=1 Tax=Corythoichthys intestinalis TaxID=161448 RepID=UPI0025A5F060|nr:exostosin-like 2 [Corythoichthys intestinalis]
MYNPSEQKTRQPLDKFRFRICQVGSNKACLFFCLLLVLLLFVFALKDLHFLKGEVTQNPGVITLTKQEEFTIIIQTFKRDDILLEVLKRCLDVPHLQKILVVWNNVDKQPSQILRDSFGHHRTPILFLEQKVNRIQNRLQPFPEIHTHAVLMLDDDILLSVSDISFAFTIWKQFPDQIVGFVPRKHVETAHGAYTYQRTKLSDPHNGGGDKYSMVLIGASFFHARYLKLYQDQPEAMHSLVDTTQNCDDIAMNFVVSMYMRTVLNDTRPSGVYIMPLDMVNLEMQARSGFKGMWLRSNHFKQRSYCLNRLAQIYGVMPLQFSDSIKTRFTWLRK